MIKTLSIKNIQSHKRSTANFSKGVNVIFGPSHSGKTALIFRSLKLLLTNRPLGLSLRSDFVEDPIVVSVKNTQNDTITLTKSERGSRYVVETDNERKTFRKVGRSVPDLVKNTLNVDFNISFQDQLNPYSIFNSPTELGRRIDSAIGTEKLEKWVNVTTKRLVVSKHKLKNVMELISGDKEKLVKYDGLVELERDVERCTIIRNKISKLVSVVNDLKEYENLNSVLKRKIRRFERYSKLSDMIDALISEHDYLRLIYDQKEEIKAYGDMEISIQKMEVEVLKLKNLYIDALVVGKKCPFCFSKVTKNRINDILNKL